MAIICYPRDDADFVASDAGAFFATRTSGVYSADNNLAVSINAARQLAVASGIGWIRTDGYWGKVVVNTAAVYLPLPDADGVLDRICRAVFRWDKTANEASIILRQGELSVTPVAPARNATDELYELVLADYLVAHGETAASAERLTDQRLNEDLCGLMRDGVTRIPTAMLDAQFRANLAVLQQELLDVEAGTAFDFKPVRVENINIAAASFVDYTPAAGSAEEGLFSLGYEKRAAITVTGVLANMTPYVTLDLASVDACGADIANQFACYGGGVYMYADSVPDAAVTALTIECRKAVA